MDLFDDLPPPAEQEKCSLDLFGDLPPTSISKNTSKPHIGEKRKIVETSCNPSQNDMKKKQAFKYHLKGYVAELKGEREDMQDAHVMFNDFTSEFETLPGEIGRLSYYAIFDGHAGHRASQFAAEHLHQHIKRILTKGDIGTKDKDIKKCLIEAYKKTDEEFLQEAAKGAPTWKDGSTAVSVLVVDDVLYAANIGDSKAMVCRQNDDGDKFTIIPLSKDHSPTQYDERMRIQNAGGNVREGRVSGILEVSRSFGDGRFKHCGVICTPDVMRCSLTDKDRFLLLACDGLWKGFQVDEAVQYINKILNSTEDESATNKAHEDPSNSHDAVDQPVSKFQQACSKLASDAIRNGSSDNVTVMLVSINR